MFDNNGGTTVGRKEIVGNWETRVQPLTATSGQKQLKKKNNKPGKNLGFWPSQKNEKGKDGNENSRYKKTGFPGDQGARGWTITLMPKRRTLKN